MTATAAAATLSPSAHQLLVEHYPMARAVAARVHRHLPPGLDVEDLESIAVMGLMEACGRFDPARGVSFKTFAKHRMHGAILDALRADDWVPRSVRRRVAEVDAMTARLHEELGREASAHEVARRLDVSTDAVLAARTADTRPLLSLDAPTGEDGEGSLADLVCAPNEPVDVALERAEVRRGALAALTALPEREQLAVRLFYLEGVPLKAIGDQLGVSESRACQLCRQGTQRMRKALDPMVG